jgi:hypothetical protein
METTDYNGHGPWSRAAILERYARYATGLRIPPRDLSPNECVDHGRRVIFPVMSKVIEGIHSGDAACVRIGIEFIEEDGRFVFGRILKSNTARALRRATLSASQQQRIRDRVFAMLRAGNVPHEFREYAKLVRRIGFDPAEVGHVSGTSERVSRFRRYFQTAAK